jgi:hypothetical protein
MNTLHAKMFHVSEEDILDIFTDNNTHQYIS